MKHELLILSMGLLMVGCTSQEEYILFNQTNITTPKAQATVAKLKIPKYEYKIASHDRISITMYNHPEYGTTSASSQKEDTRGILVTSSGYISLPLIKRVRVAGLTQNQAKDKIEKAYHKFNITDAEVYVEVLNKRAYITGEVNNPGEIPLFNERLALMQVIATAGGLTDAANRQAIVILQKRGNEIHTKTVDLTGPDSLKVANLMIHPNDTIYVTPNNMKSFNTGVSEVSPSVGLIGSVVSPVASLSYLFDSTK
ncbi:MAG: polysaccharide biosynthesis/export family protein [Sulfurovum sp.]|nr:polysaccharide biosynthesis/export family protein [Sulfurovum sp.]